MQRLWTLLSLGTLLFISARGHAAETVALFLKANGTDVQGESAITSLGRMNSIQCLAFEHKVRTGREAATGRTTGRRQYEPILIRKRIDKSSPLIAKALAQNEVIEGVFRFFRSNPNGDGTTQHFLTIEIKGGRVASQSLYVPDTIVPATATHPPLEEVTFIFTSFRIRYESTGAEFSDSIGGNFENTLAAPIGRPAIVRPPLLLSHVLEWLGVQP